VRLPFTSFYTHFLGICLFTTYFPTWKLERPLTECLQQSATSRCPLILNGSPYFFPMRDVVRHRANSKLVELLAGDVRRRLASRRAGLNN